MKRENLVSETNKHDFQQFKTIRFFANNICEGKSALDNTDKVLKLMISIKTRNENILVRKKKKIDTIDDLNTFCKGRETVVNAFKSGIFSLQLTTVASNIGVLARIARVSDSQVLDHASPKILNPKQMIQRLSIAPAQVQAGHTFEILLNYFRQIICSLY